MSSIIERVVNTMIDRNMQMDDFDRMLGEIVYDDPEVMTENELHTKLIKNLNLDFETDDPIFCSINAMMARTMKVAYKKGFQDGISVLYAEK